jgi:glutaredoxin
MPAFDSIKSKVMNVVTNKQVIMILVITAIFIGVIFWVYNNYIAPKINPDFDVNNEFINENTQEIEKKDITITMFSTSWCPHCKAAKEPEKGGWAIASTDANMQNINGYNIIWENVDGEKDEKKMKDFEKKYGLEIDGYPSIFLVKDNNVIEFNSQITKANLENFISTTL